MQVSPGFQTHLEQWDRKRPSAGQRQEQSGQEGTGQVWRLWQQTRNVDVPSGQLVGLVPKSPG